jgi:cyclopropane fatty-acyl-phospholipid synthase-like methyltransferase
MTPVRTKTSTQSDLAGQAFWNSLWASKRHSRAVGAKPLNVVEEEFERFFDQAFGLLGGTSGKQILEIGCGDSGWLPYFAKRWGFAVSGLDYSRVGCERAADLARNAGVAAEITCADLFAPPAALENRFDAVISMGVVEHFQDTPGALRALARFLNEDGIVVTTVPNMAGIDGTLMKWINRAVYDMHVPLDAPALAAAHTDAGLDVVRNEYLLGLHLGIVNAAGLDPAKLTTKLRQLLVLGFIAFSRAVGSVERTLRRRLPTSRAFSPFVGVIARRKIRDSLAL